MAERTISQLIEDSTRELQEAVEERDRLSVRVIELQNQLASLRALAAMNSLTEREPSLIGLTDAIRSVMRIGKRPMAAHHVKFSLALVGYNFGGLENPSAAIHSTMKRMTDSGELSYDPTTKEYKIVSPAWMDGARRRMERLSPRVLESRNKK
jgi:hypothetical protein